MSSTPYNPPQWVPYPNAIPINAEYTGTASLANSIGDLMWFDATVNTLKPVSQIADQGSAALTQALAASLFAGVSNSQQLSTDATARQARVLIDGIFEFACASTTFNPGDYVTFTWTSQGVGVTGALADQTVTKTNNPALAIGRVVRQYTANTTVVKVRITSRLFAGFLADHNWATNNQAAPGNSNSSAGTNMSESGGAGYAGTTGTAGNGGSASQIGGAGGSATTGTSGTGGAATVTGGVGGAATTGTAGTGGASSDVGGAGGAVTTGTAGTGGASSVTGGTGGAATGAATTGGTGGAANVTSGAGGATSGSGNSPGGAAGTLTLAGGVGGAAGAGTGNGGAGGNVVINGGAGGTTTGGSAGAAGTVTIQGATAVGANNTVQSAILFSSTAKFGLYWGTGAPTNAAAVGSLFIRTDGSTSATRAYVCCVSSGTWVSITTSA